jgi:ABC-type nitrate/sulfonate/bicarbonate transport system ATPase subunit
MALCEHQAIDMAILELQNVSFSYSDILVVNNLDLAIEASGIVSIMGPSGCGKSTVLRLMSGLEKPSLGRCLFDGKQLDQPSPKLRYSFQDFDAFPWRTVRQNLLLGGASIGGGGDSISVGELAEKVGLSGHEHKYPVELSGGMRKRLALGRCLAGRPEVILLDEPFSSLDVDARQELYELLQSLWAEWHCLFVIITHDIHEAIVLSTRVIISEALPFRTKCTVEVPFQFPRNSSISEKTEYMDIFRAVRGAL